MKIDNIHDEDAVLNIFEYVEVLKRRKWTAIVSFVIVLISTFWLVVTAKPEYLATAKIAISPDFSELLLPDSSAYIDTYYLEAINIETELQILQSRPLTENVVESLGLAKRDEPDKFKRTTDMLTGLISVKKPKDSRIFVINAANTDPDMAQKIANTLVDVYIKSVLDKKISSYRNSLSWLNEQLVDLKKKVEISELNLLNYVEKEKIISTPQAVLPGSNSETYSPEQSRLLEDLNNKLVNTELEYRKLLIKYKGKHPKVQKLSAEIAELKKKIEEEKQKIIENNKRTIKYSIMKREVDLNKELYNSFMKKLKELDIASEVKKSNVSVIEYAQKPGKPVKPQKGLSIIIGILAGTIIGIFMAFIREYLDRTIRNEEQISEYFNIPILGVIPHMETDGNNKIQTINSFSAKSTEAEFYRILRTNLKLSQLGKKSNSILITSTAPNEGKTTTSVNLGITLAQSGSKTLIIDVDLRKPQLHNIFNLSRQAGLTDLLIGEIKNFGDAISPSPVNNLFILPTGIIAPNPSELLESGNIKDIIQYTLENYDQVIIDSPPMGMVSDTIILSNLVDGIIIVFSAGKTDRFIAAKGIRLLNQNRLHIYGAVLNNLKKEDIYKSSYYYYYSSQVGYGKDMLQKEAVE
ncbi:MAG TPA: polysaccharide biosynthesis tyrosine autokinase [bacterium]